MKSKIEEIIKSVNDISNNTSTIYNVSNETSGNTTHVYKNEEAGDYIEKTYKGIKVCVRENYPYYNPQNDKIYYSPEEEAEELYQLAQEMTKSSLPKLDDI